MLCRAERAELLEVRLRRRARLLLLFAVLFEEIGQSRSGEHFHRLGLVRLLLMPQRLFVEHRGKRRLEGDLQAKRDESL